MNKRYLKIPFLIGFMFFLGNCASGIETRKLIYRDHKSAFFSFDADELSKKEMKNLGNPFLHPIRNTDFETWKATLGNLRFRKESTVGTMVYHVFSEAELDDLCVSIPVALEKLNSTQMLVVVSKYNDLKGVVSNDHRTTFAVFKNREGINLLFREIHAGLEGMDSTNYYEWSKIPEFNLIKNYEVFRVEKEDYLKYSDNSGFKNRLWVIVDPDRMDEIQFLPRPKFVTVSDIPRLDDDGNPIDPQTNGNKKNNRDITPPKTEIQIQRDLD